MEKLAKGIGITIMSVGGIYLTISAGPLFGALSGWLMSILFPNWISGGFAVFGMHIAPEDFYKVGATLGWVGGFIRYSPRFKTEGAVK